jgi:phosphoribosylformimino-5-aminoimidazole carboxamide ribotide isomerase
MIVIPAIDIINGKVVRLFKGGFDDVSIYADNPLDVAKKWVDQGATRIHLVDLDGAQTGTMKNREIVVQIANELSVPVEVGGGIRQQEDIDFLLNEGAQYVILGTKIIEDRNFLQENLGKWKHRIIASLDCKAGMVAQRGWVETSDLKGTTLAKDLEALGLSSLIYTDIARDGTLKGPNFQGINEMLDAVDIPVIASGGVSKIEDIQKLCALKKENLFGVVTGKALYENKLNLKQAIDLCSTNA